MTKRVLALLMVMAMVLSLMPTAIFAEGGAAETADPGYIVTFGRSHNQPDGGLGIDVYLEATADDQGDVAGFQFTATPVEDSASVVAIYGADGETSLGGVQSQDGEGVSTLWVAEYNGTDRKSVV